MPLHLYHYVCPVCDRRGYQEVNKTKGAFTCFTCKTTTKIEKITFAKVECENCEQKYDITVLNDCYITKCRNCRGPIDLRFNHKKGYYVSGNRK